MQGDFRDLDLFFHAHGFVNAETFVSRSGRDPPPGDKHQPMAILDHLFIRSTVKKVLPPNVFQNTDGKGVPRRDWGCQCMSRKYALKNGIAPEVYDGESETCKAQRRFRGHDCGPAYVWGNPHPEWGACAA